MTRSGPDHAAPLSWLVLERYALGELDAVERARIAARLAEDETSRACLARIEAERSSPRPLRPLPAELLAAQPRPTATGSTATGSTATGSTATGSTATGSTAVRETAARPSLATRWRWLLAAAGPALAAALLLLVLWPRQASHVTPPGRTPWPARVAIKGGDLALSLVRERAGVTTTDPRGFRDGDRFKVLVTAPLGSGLAAEVIVLQGGERYLPLPRSATLAGGNRRALDGAFALDGVGPVDVCLLAAAQLPPRSALAHISDARALQGPGRHVVCLRLLGP